MASQGSNWGPLWDEAATKYKEERKKYAEEHTSWVSRHIKKKSKDGDTLDFDDIPDLTTGEDFAIAFNDEIERRRSEFGDMRAIGAGVANTMLALSIPLKALLDQASSIGGMVSTPVQIMPPIMLMPVPVLSWNTDDIFWSALSV
jgi:hypothetical protein